MGLTPEIKYSYPFETLTSKDRTFCEKVAKEYWCNTKTGEWGKGLINAENNWHATYIGLLGEVAFGKRFKTSPDFAFKYGGDRFDFILNNKTVNVKTSVKFPDFKAGLVRAINSTGKSISINQDIYVFCFLDKDIVYFAGWQTKDYIKSLPNSAAIKGNHFNKMVHFSNLLPIEDLYV